MLPIARPPNPNASVRQVSPAKTTKPDANAGSAHPVPLEPARRRLNGTKVKKSQCRWHVTGYAAGGQTKKMAFFRQTLTKWPCGIRLHLSPTRQRGPCLRGGLRYCRFTHTDFSIQKKR